MRDMIKITQKKYTFVVILVVAFASLSLVAWYSFNATSFLTDKIGLSTDISNEPLLFSHAQWPYDPTDTKAVVTNSQAIFIGQIITREENYSTGAGFSSPLFVVRVISVLKGDLSSGVKLLQSDIEYRNARTYVMEGDIAWPKNVRAEDILLHEGSTYLFATYETKATDTYGIGIAPYDRELITTDASLADSSIIELAKQNPRVQEIINASVKIGALNTSWK